MRNRIVHMQQIQRLGLKDFQHLGGERQGIGWVIEQRIGRDFHFVKMRVGIVGIHADRRRVADEVDVVPARRQFRAQLRSHHA